MALSQIQSRTGGPSQEYLLLDYMRRLGRNVEGRKAVQIHLSRLRPRNRKDHHVRIAVATFEEMVQNYEGQIFALGNSDLFYICKDAAVDEIDGAIIKVRYLFNEDPLTQGDDEEDLARFCTWFNVAAQHKELLDLVKQMHRDRERTNRLAATKDKDKADQLNNVSLKELVPEQLGKLEALLAQADLSNLMRRQPVCAVTPTNPKPQPVFRELYISIADLQQTVLPEFDL
ncbi:MAG: hypothetical protein CMM47_01770, partial [Rhodospirillaceae bacterium]|nr:hypothetical protein [Rhodospirillaceae bacterium]